VQEVLNCLDYLPQPGQKMNHKEGTDLSKSETGLAGKNAL